MGKQKNAFVIYFEQYINLQKQSGRNISKKIAAEECGPKWRQLSNEEKQVYIDLANAYRCDKRKEIEAAASVEAENKPNDDLKYLTTVIDSKEALKNHKFYIIHTNYYCKTAEALYVPAELAIAEFNLKNGLLRTYHSLIDPGDIPLGYAYDAKRNSDEVHGLPLPPYEEGDKNFEEILNTVAQFMEPSKENSDSFAPFFTVEKNIAPTMNVLENLIIFKFGENINSFTVFPIHKMFFWIKNKCSEYCQSSESGFPVLSNAWTEIERDVFRYCTGISCEFHKDSAEKYHNCSLSVVQRLVYLICDHCCRYLGIELIRGKHVPLNFTKDKIKTENTVKKEFSTSYSKIVSAGSSDCNAQSSYARSNSDNSSRSLWVPKNCEVRDMERKPKQENDEMNLQLHYGDDDFSSDDDLFVTIGRGSNMSSKKRVVGGQRTKDAQSRLY